MGDPLLIAGMHRSGTSLFASFLAAAGVDVGQDLVPADSHNRHGYFEDRAFVELHQEILGALTPAGEPGWPDWGWTESQRIDRSGLSAFRTKARRLIEERGRAGAPWGFKDPRSSLLLDFWRDLLPTARYLFIYRSPWEVASSMDRLGAPVFTGRPDFAPRIWTYYNRHLLDFYAAHPERCLLLSLEALVREPRAVLERLRSKLSLTTKSDRAEEEMDRLLDRDLLRRESAAPALIDLQWRLYPQAADVWRALEATADLPSGAPLLAPRGSAAVDGEVPVSVIVPCYNDGRLLPEAVASIEQCTEPIYEIVIVNDGSNDPHTLDVLGRLKAAGYTMHDQENRGLAAARNTGIRAARGRYLLPLDSDNRLRPAYLLRGIEVLEREPGVGVVYADAEYFGDRSGPWRLPDFDLDLMLAGNRIDACALFRREVWKDCGGYDESATMRIGWEDWDFWLSATERGWRFHHLAEPLFEYRTRAGSMISDCAVPEKRRQLLAHITAKHAALYSQHLPALFADHDARWRLEEELRIEREKVQRLEAELSQARRESVKEN